VKADATDNMVPSARSENMRRVRGKNTRPEMLVRSIAHRLGFRFRLHRSDLPGKPDLVFPKYRAVVFVNGCFWHGHDCRRGRRPSSNQAFWDAKLEENAARDRRAEESLRALGWRVLVLWECELRDEVELGARLDSFLRNAEGKDHE
jgi:DNA mismatch endonuclease (patch repair protein)